MTHYQVLARRYRPQRFADVIGQDVVVTTLKNAILAERTAHAYLFCGPRGTGKTTFARLLAKSLNCGDRGTDAEPCNVCASCIEITKGHSLDVIEIDGASNRGIDEIRKINDAAGFSSSARYRIYIIDEVHMLTKEAFNALLKTLEEPPPQAKFLFATTEPHKVLPTIISRCQRFNLRRISTDLITQKLQKILAEEGVEAEPAALRLIAQRAEGGMRDAESLLDQILSFHSGTITEKVAAQTLGVMSRTTFFALDQAGKGGDLAEAFAISEALFSQGKDLYHFVDGLLEHFRNILVCQLSGGDSPTLDLSKEEREQYKASAKLYSQEQCLGIIDDLVATQAQLKNLAAARTAVEALLLRILRSHTRVPVDFLIRRLAELEATVQSNPSQTPIEPAPPKPPPAPEPKPKEQKKPATVTASPEPQKDSRAVKEATAPPPSKVIHTDLPHGQVDTLLQFASVELGGTLEKKKGLRT